MAKFTKVDLDNLICKAELLRGIPIPTFVDALSVEEWFDAGGWMLLGFPNEQIYLAHQEIWQNVPNILTALEEAWGILDDLVSLPLDDNNEGLDEVSEKAMRLLGRVGFYMAED